MRHPTPISAIAGSLGERIAERFNGVISIGWVEAQRLANNSSDRLRDVRSHNAQLARIAGDKSDPFVRYVQAGDPRDTRRSSDRTL
jgi:hypothetical protein